MPLNADHLLAVLPYPVLTNIVGNPTLENITLQKSEHNGNLASVKSNLGDVLTGLMVISMNPATFATIHPDPFTIPTNPVAAPNPDVIAAASSATKIADIYKAYALQSKIYSEFIEAKKISVKLELDLMDKIYYKALKHTYTGYAKVSLRQLIDHLITTYAAIDQFDLEKNQEKMTARYNPNAPIETLFEQITDGVAYAELGDAPFTSKPIFDIALLCLAKTGVFHEDLKGWNQKPPLSRDWNTFIVHFAKAHREWKANLRLNAGKNLPWANTVDTFNPTADHQSDTVEALANLATATASDRATVTTLTDTIAQISLELASAQVKLILSVLDNQKLLKRLSKKGGNWNTSGGGAYRKIYGGGTIIPWDGLSIHYCHTHGYKCPHPSFKCPEPTTGIIKNATKKDIREGKDQDYKNK